MEIAAKVNRAEDAAGLRVTAFIRGSKWP